MLVEYKIICTVLPYSGLVKYKGGSKRFETDIQFLIWNNYEHILLTKIKLIKNLLKLFKLCKRFFFHFTKIENKEKT